MSVISIATGNCGINIQEQQWRVLLEEQGIDSSGNAHPKDFNQKYETYFEEVSSNRYKPRALIVDLGDDQINQLENGSIGKLFQGGSLITFSTLSANNCARAKQTLRYEKEEQIADEIKRLAESCDKVDSFQIQRSLCGGTGSGIGEIISEAIIDSYFSEHIQNQLIQLPDPEEKGSSIEIINMALAYPNLVMSDIVLPFCNSKVQKLANDSLTLQKCKNFEDINSIVSQIHPTFTCGIRYSGTINASSRKICLNLVPFPRVKLMTTTILPLNYCLQFQKLEREYHELIPYTVNKKYFISQNEDPEIITARHIFRGSNIHEEEIEMSLAQLNNSDKSHAPDWIPNAHSLQYCSVPPPNSNKQILTMLLNKNIYKQLEFYYNQFNALFQRKAFIHYYLGEGLDEMEFYEALSHMRDSMINYEIL